MRKSALLLAVLTLVLVAGCGGQAASPTSSPTAIPPTATATPTVVATPFGPATCEPFPLNYPANPDIPPITGEDHVRGPAGAAITLIEYSDFQ